jgi:rare lipoprotein A (peptidoglycan hydrolase)
MRLTKRALAVALITVGFTPAIPAAQAAPRHCSKTFTVKMFSRAAYVAYGATRIPSSSDIAHLARYERCGKHPWTRTVDARIWRHRKAANWARRHPPMVQEVASWYSDGGSTACGFHATYGVAHKSLPCGTKVRFALNGRTVTATVDDRGPYIGGREWDLNQNTAAALGFGGVGAVWVHVG